MLADQYSLLHFDARPQRLHGRPFRRGAFHAGEFYVNQRVARKQLGQHSTDTLFTMLPLAEQPQQ